MAGEKNTGLKTRRYNGWTEYMNNSLYIILVPALMVAAGYVFVLRYMGFAPGYPRLIIAMVVFFGAIYWLSRRRSRKPRPNQP